MRSYSLFYILLKALIKESITYAVIAPKLELILVDTTRIAKAESLLSALREAVEGLAVRPLITKIDVSTTLTSWAHNQQAYNGFTILEDCQLEDCLDTKGIIRCKNHGLSNEIILDHLKSGMLVTSLSLNWRDKLSFVLDKRLGIKRIKFDDIILEEASKEGADDAAEQFDMSFILMIFTLSEFIPELIQALGSNR